MVCVVASHGELRKSRFVKRARVGERGMHSHERKRDRKRGRERTDDEATHHDRRIAGKIV
jgi:hypothetical protein